MYGRYGHDDLNRFLFISVLIVYIVFIFTQWTMLNSLAMVLLFLCIFRMLSRSTEKREQENRAFLKAKRKLTDSFHPIIIRLRQRKTHRFYKCPSCKQSLRVPKGKGRITIHCPKCHTSFKKKT